MRTTARLESHPGRPEAPPATWWDHLWRPFWALPTFLAGASLALGLLMPALDQAFGEPWPWVFEGGVDGARSVLGTIAGAMISVTGLVFSITMVVLQLASSQYSPRVLGNFLESRVSQATLGVFTGSFVYALTVLRSVGQGSVPQMSVSLAYLYVLAAVAMFLAFIHHITTAVQVSRVMSDVRRHTLRAVDQLVAGERPVTTWSPRPGTARTDLRMDDRSGYVAVLDSSLLVARARDLDVVVELVVAPGDFIAPGQHVGRVWGVESLDGAEATSLTGAVQLSGARTWHHDVGLGVRQLLDIAERALSPGVNDPTTAVQAGHELHVILRRLAGRPDASPYLLDDDGAVRATYRAPRFAQLLAVVVEELTHYGRDAVRVVPQLRVVLEDLAEAALVEHRPAVESALAAVDGFLETVFSPTLTLHDHRDHPANP